MDIKVNRKEVFKLLGFVGAAMIVSGYVGYSIHETLTLLHKILLIGGGVLLVASLVVNFGALRAYSRRRSARLGVNTVVMTVAVVAITGAFNFLGYRHHKRIDLTSEKLYSLSDQTRKIVAGLNQDVKIIQFNKVDAEGLDDRMQEFRDLNKRLSYERIDPQAKPEIAKQYSVSRMGEVIVSSGSRTERPEQTDEQSLDNAIIKVTREKLKNVCFVEGHGEKDIASTDKADGYGQVNAWLKGENYETKTINLVTANQVPPDCDVLVLAGPKQALFPQEAAMIGKYLEQGGKAMLLIDPDTDPKLADVLKAWKIQLDSDTVLDFSGVGRLFGTGPGVPLVRTYATHAITKDFGSGMTFFPLARSLTVLTESGSDASTTELLKTSDDSFGKTELKPGAEVTFDEGKDKKGPVTLGVVADKAVGDKQARLVVIGDSDFATNNYSQLQRNGDLFMNSVSWLAQDEDLISIRPKPAADRRITMTSSEQNTLYWITIVLMPGAVIASGVYIWWKRR